MVSPGTRDELNCSDGFCCNDSCSSSEDSTTSIRTLLARGGSCPVFALCPSATNTTIAHNADVRSKIILATFGSRFTRILVSWSLRILRRGWRLRGIGIPLGFVSLQRFLRLVGLFVLELLEGCHGFLRVSETMEPAIHDSELVPGLLDNFGIGAGGRRSALQTLSSTGVIAEEHFRAAKIVVHVEQIRLLSQCGLDEVLALCAVTLFDHQHAQLIFGQHVVGIDFQFAYEGIVGLLHLSEVSILRTQLLVQAGLGGS